jgi:hypothetical protein
MVDFFALERDTVSGKSMMNRRERATQWWLKAGAQEEAGCPTADPWKNCSCSAISAALVLL